MRYGGGSTVLISIALVIFILITGLTVFAQETKNRIFTQEELELYNGTKGRPAYVAVEGKVYDVSESQYWKDGFHQKMHQAGGNLTEELNVSPHGNEVLQDMVQVGVLAKSDRLPAFLRTLSNAIHFLKDTLIPFLCISRWPFCSEGPSLCSSIYFALNGLRLSQWHS